MEKKTIKFTLVRVNEPLQFTSSIIVTNSGTSSTSLNKLSSHQTYSPLLVTRHKYMFQLIMAQYELNVTDWKRKGIFVTGETGDATHAQIREFRMQFISNNFLDLCFIYSVLLFIHT